MVRQELIFLTRCQRMMQANNQVGTSFRYLVNFAYIVRCLEVRRPESTSRQRSVVSTAKPQKM